MNKTKKINNKNNEIILPILLNLLNYSTEYFYPCKLVLI